MHEALSSPVTAAPRVVHDVLVHLVRKRGVLTMIRVAVPAAWDQTAFQRALTEALEERQLMDVRVATVPTEHSCRLLSVLVQ